ncbi:MAG: hypothetical protein K2Y39_27660 [Candidatus Obscuribacterales bacterium]|nr:hypothetical protein [Candidatus Obscuribacterales bacterium]
MAKKLTRDQVLAAWKQAVANGTVLKVQKLGKRVMAVRHTAAGFIATKENRFPGQPISAGDWRIVALNDDDDPIAALEKGNQIYVYKDSAGNLVQFDEKHQAALVKEPLFDTWINRQADFLRNYAVSDSELIIGMGVARANPTINYAIPLTEEIEIETSWGSAATGSHWLVAYKVDPATLGILEYDFNIVDTDAAQRSYKVAGSAVPTGA